MVSCYDFAEDSTWLKMFVRLDEIEYKSTFIAGKELKSFDFCSTGKVKESDFPVGTRVKVQYL